MKGVQPMRVYILNLSGHMMEGLNKLDSKGYDKIILTEGTINPFNTDRLKYEIEQKMLDIEPNDVLLLSGSPIINVLASNIAKERTGRVNVLLYGAKEKDYVLRENIV